MRSIERGAVLLGKYRADCIIGQGGMGLVVKAWHLGLDEEVAIKVLRDDVALADETIARFIREAQAAAKLKSEHVARIIDVGAFEDGKPYLVMEFLEGQDIGQLLAERGRLQPSLAIDLVIQACEALAEAHSLGIVHRDIKPTNLFLTSRPDGTVLLKILDFGISKSPAGAELSLTQTWSLLGSPAYMSPEQMRSARNVDARTDIWSLGAVLYEAIEGHLPFQAESFSEMCVMVAVDSPAPMTATPHELAPIIARCLAKAPDERYANVADLARDLACLAREPDKARALVDRMYRMLRRGPLRRTPPAGVPLSGATGQLASASPTQTGPFARARPMPTGPHAPLPGPTPPGPFARARPVPTGPFAPLRTPTPADPFARPRPTPTGQFAPVPTDPFTPVPTDPFAPVPSDPFAPVPSDPFAPVPTPTPPGYPTAAPLGTATGLARASEPSPAGGVPAIPYPGVSSGGMAAAALAVTAPPFASPAPAPRPVQNPQRPVFPGYTYAVSLPVPPGRDARFLRPGFQLPRGAASLTATHVISRHERGWIVSLLVALVVLAAAAVVIVLRSRPAAAHGPATPAAVRVFQDPEPAPAGPAAPAPGPAAPPTTSR